MKAKEAAQKHLLNILKRPQYSPVAIARGLRKMKAANTMNESRQVFLVWPKSAARADPIKCYAKTCAEDAAHPTIVNDTLAEEKVIKTGDLVLTCRIAGIFIKVCFSP